MARDHKLHLTPQQHLLIGGLEQHGMPRATARRLVAQHYEAHVLRELCYFNYECGGRPHQRYDWRRLAIRIRNQVPAPLGYPFEDAFSF